MIHEGLVLVEAEKYASPETRFSFTFQGTSATEVADSDQSDF
jgi:hypothetical protein